MVVADNPPCGYRRTPDETIAYRCVENGDGNSDAGVDRDRMVESRGGQVEGVGGQPFFACRDERQGSGESGGGLKDAITVGSGPSRGGRERGWVKRKTRLDVGGFTAKSMNGELSKGDEASTIMKRIKEGRKDGLVVWFRDAKTGR